MKLEGFAHMGKVWELWQKAADDAMARFDGVAKEIEKAEARRIEQASTAIDEAARLTKETLAYGAQLGASFRKLSFEAFQHAAAQGGDVAG
jgi:hypothetical protein